MDATAANPWLATAIVVGSGLVIYLILVGTGARFVDRVEKKTPGSAARVLTLWVMVRRVTLIVILVLVVLMLIDIWGLSMAPFLAVGTAIAAALGFGAQNLIRDVIAGFFILAEDQYRIGDTVTVAATTGKVEDIQFRVTVLRDGEGMSTSSRTGRSPSPPISPVSTCHLPEDVRVGYQADVDRAMEVMLDELMKLSAEAPWSDMITKEPQMLGVQDLVGSGGFFEPDGPQWPSSVGRSSGRRCAG